MKQNSQLNGCIIIEQIPMKCIPETGFCSTPKLTEKYIRQISLLGIADICRIYSRYRSGMVSDKLRKKIENNLLLIREKKLAIIYKDIFDDKR